VTRTAPLVCVVTDRHRVTPVVSSEGERMRAFDRWLDEVVDAGPDIIQIRERDLDARSLVSICRRVVGRARATGARVVVNDRADVARVAGADGVHLRADAPPAARVRSISRAPWLVGRSVHSVDEVRRHQDADYLVFGTVFASRSKPGAELGPDVLRAAAGASEQPVIAIGGVTVEGARRAVRAGARGVAAIGLFLPVGAESSALGPARAVAALRAAMLE